MQNVQPRITGTANTVYHACLKPGDSSILDLSHGGHLTHGSPVNFSGRIYTPSMVSKKNRTDYDKIQIATKEQPNYRRASAYSRDIDFERFRVIADSVGAILLADISHLPD
jgi:glycine hydroxymethyltransferase